MDEIFGYNPYDRASFSEEGSRKSRRRTGSKKKNAPTYENQKEVFNKDTLEEIRLFREARSQYLQARDSRKGEFATDSSDFLFGDGQSRRKQPNWFKRVSQGFMDFFNRDRGAKKSPVKTQPSAKEKYMEEGVRPHPARSIMKIVTQKDIEEREKKEKEREKELKGEGSTQDFTIVDEKPVGKRKRRESSDLIVDEVDSRRRRDSDDVTVDDLYDGDYESIRKKRRDLDDTEMDPKKKKIFAAAKGKQKGKKPLKFSRIPGPEEQCRCDHSGEYTVLVKGVCFCDRPKRPTCIPIIPPEYFKPHQEESLEALKGPERLKLDAKILRKDSIIVHRKKKLRRSKNLLNKEEREEDDDEPKKEKEEEEEEKELIEPTPEASEEVLTPTPDDQQSKTKKYDDVRYEKLMAHHGLKYKEDQHTPMHFQELPDEKSDITIKPSRNDSLLSKSPSEIKRHPFLLRRKGSRLTSEGKHPRGEPLFEKPSAIIKTVKKDKNHKPEHGHVHFDTTPHEDISHEDLDTNKYYTKYGKSAENYKRKTTMTAMVEFFNDWWKRKP